MSEEEELLPWEEAGLVLTWEAAEDEL